MSALHVGSLEKLPPKLQEGRSDVLYKAHKMQFYVKKQAKVFTTNKKRKEEGSIVGLDILMQRQRTCN